MTERAPLVLPTARAGPYLRALQAALHIAAPDQDWPSTQAAALHLRLLDPAHSGELLAPAEVDAVAGLPTHGWLERAAAERRAHHDPVQLRRLIERADRVDPVLAARLRARLRVSATRPGAPVLGALAVGAALVRTGPHPAARVHLDRRLPSVGWVRVRADLRGRSTSLDGLRGLQGGDQLAVDDGLAELLLRHTLSPLALLAQTLEQACGAEVDRLSRAVIGPFWFPGVHIPGGVPPAVARSLLLHLHRDCLSIERSGVQDGDPLRPRPTPPPGRWGLVRERHLVAHRGGLAAVSAWQPTLSVRAFG